MPHWLRDAEKQWKAVMMNHPIEGTLVQARPRSRWFGQQSFDAVVVRRADGSEAEIGRVSVPVELAGAMAPGSRGRFYFHDVLGQQGMHGFKPLNGAARGAFPRLAEDAFGALTMINLVILATMLTLDGNLRLMPALMAALGTTLWIALAASRQAIVHDFEFEEGVAKARRDSAAQRARHQLV
jgi:hypothetical protein